MVPTIVRTMLKQLLSDLGDTAARKAIPQLQPAERSILAHQLISQAQRTPGNVKAFQALMEIAELDEPIAEDFKAVVMRIQKTDLAPALAIHIVTTSKKQNALGKVCQAIVVSGQDGRTPFEKSLKQKPR